MNKETKKDIWVMAFQFIGAFIVFLLIVNLDFEWITGEVVLVGEFIYHSFLWMGFLFPIILIFVLSWRSKWMEKIFMKLR